MSKFAEVGNLRKVSNSLFWYIGMYENGIWELDAWQWQALSQTVTEVQTLWGREKSSASQWPILLVCGFTLKHPPFGEADDDRQQLGQSNTTAIVSPESTQEAEEDEDDEGFED